MDLVSFVAHSAADAVAQIRSRLGPNAVVVEVRPLPNRGLRRLWRRSGFEVLACRAPEGSMRLDVTSDMPALPADGALASSDPALNNGATVRAMGSDAPAPGAAGSAGNEFTAAQPLDALAGDDSARWPIVQVLERTGLHPIHAQQVLDHLERQGHRPGGVGLREQLGLVRSALVELWRKPPQLIADSLRPHVLVGPAGSGKTTCLCKWLTQSVLLEDRRAQVWRLDSTTANTAEALEVYCQALGVPVERSWHLGELPQQSIQFVDLPGTDWRQASALQDLAKQLRTYPTPHVHLVLNAAYETDILLQQARAFGVLPVEDLILSHLDEEPRWGKIWNLTLGTNFPVRFLSSGQNIPGGFALATPEAVLSRQLPS